MIKLDDCSYGLLLLVRFSRHSLSLPFFQILERFDVEYPILFDNQNAISKSFNPSFLSRAYSQRFLICRGMYCHIISSSSFRAFLIHKYLDNFPFNSSSVFYSILLVYYSDTIRIPSDTILFFISFSAEEDMMFFVYFSLMFFLSLLRSEQ